MTHIIQIHKIEKNYGVKEVLKGIDLNLEKGEIYALLGKNGAGKSTLFKIISGLTLPTSGTINLFSSPISSDSKKKMGISINQPTFYEHLDAYNNLEIHCQYMNYSFDKQQFKRVMNMVGLSTENKSPTKLYSLGMRQRLMLARCLIHEPELLIIDEPLNGLDPKGIKQVRTLIQSIAQTGVTILISSHILSEVEAVATRIGVLSKGNLIFSKKAASLKQIYGTRLEDILIQKMEGDLS